MNSGSENPLFMEVVKVCLHSVMFMAIGAFTYVIVVTVNGSPHLRRNVHYLLLLKHCVCLTSFNAAGSVLHCIRALRLSVTRLACWSLFDFQVVMGRGIVFTLTLMCMCTCLSVCSPLHYEGVVRASYRWVMLVMWILALINPLVFTVLACMQKPWDYVIAPDPDCSTALEGDACIISAFLLLIVMVLLIFISYVLICLEGHHAGHFSSSNSKGRCTILIHALQISLHIVPIFIILSRVRLELAEELITFLIFSISQVLSPIIYGMRCKELNREFPRFFPRFCKQRVSLESSMSTEQRGSTGTVSSTMGTVNSSGTSNSIITVHVSDSGTDDKNKHSGEDQQE
ncbi:Olfactory receptor 4K17 [Bagarius yarrelli]|uniref:Olfactory receptor 4K17 n=1 Tax=Bagarius yarrelli TaxID=175774 RepID=A0A556V3J5_BAGYA|nr:Olfactory receptor 4K17 [Bagarius yarrelli]